MGHKGNNPELPVKTESLGSGRALALGLCLALGIGVVATPGCKKRVESGAETQSKTGFHLDTLQSAPENLDRSFACPAVANGLRVEVEGRPFDYILSEPDGKMSFGFRRGP